MIDSEDYDEFDLDVYIENNPEGPQVVSPNTVASSKIGS